MEKWFAFRAFNKGTLYGYGTAEDAERYCDLANAGREIDLLAAHEVSETDAARMKLEENGEAFNLEDELFAREQEPEGDDDRFHVEDEAISPPGL